MKRLVSHPGGPVSGTAFSACNTNSPASSGDATSGASTQGLPAATLRRARYHSVLDFLHRSDGEYARDITTASTRWITASP